MLKFDRHRGKALKLIAEGKPKVRADGVDESFLYLSPLGQCTSESFFSGGRQSEKALALR